jgi:hypothetical protein
MFRDGVGVTAQTAEFNDSNALIVATDGMQRMMVLSGCDPILTQSP